MATRKTNIRSEAQHNVMKLVTQPAAGQIASRHRWASEKDRCHELLFALISRAVSLPMPQVRRTCDNLRRVGLLDLKTWIAEDANSAGDRATLKKRVEIILEEDGVARDEARRVCELIEEFADAISQRLSGKLQVALREIGNDAVNRFVNIVKLQSLSKEEIRSALIFWLQNVANLPIASETSPLEEFCARSGVTVAQLMEAADELDVSIPFLEDLAGHSSHSLQWKRDHGDQKKRSV